MIGWYIFSVLRIMHISLARISMKMSWFSYFPLIKLLIHTIIIIIISRKKSLPASSVKILCRILLLFPFNENSKWGWTITSISIHYVIYICLYSSIYLSSSTTNKNRSFEHRLLLLGCSTLSNVFDDNTGVAVYLTETNPCNIWLDAWAWMIAIRWMLTTIYMYVM